MGIKSAGRRSVDGSSGAQPEDDVRDEIAEIADSEVEGIFLGSLELQKIQVENLCC